MCAWVESPEGVVSTIARNTPLASPSAQEPAVATSVTSAGTVSASFEASSALAIEKVANAAIRVAANFRNIKTLLWRAVRPGSALGPFALFCQRRQFDDILG